MPRQPRKSRRLAAKQRLNLQTEDDTTASEIFGLTPRRGRRETLTAATALERAEAAANLHDNLNRSAGEGAISHRGASPAGSLGPSPHASRLHWTSEEGTDADDEFGDEIDEEDSKLPDIDTDEDDDAGYEPRSPEEEKPTRSDLDFIALEEGIDKDDETYVLTASEDEEEGLTYLLQSGTLTPEEKGIARRRLSTIKGAKARRTLWLERAKMEEEMRRELEGRVKGYRPKSRHKAASQPQAARVSAGTDDRAPDLPHVPAMASGVRAARRRPTSKERMPRATPNSNPITPDPLKANETLTPSAISRPTRGSPGSWVRPRTWYPKAKTTSRHLSRKLRLNALSSAGGVDTLSVRETVRTTINQIQSKRRRERKRRREKIRRRKGKKKK